MEYWIIPVGYRRGAKLCGEDVVCTAPGDCCNRCIFNPDNNKYTIDILNLYREGKLK